TLGLIQPAAARQRVVAEARRLLRPGGVFLLHVHNRLAAWSRPGQRRWLVADLARSSWTGREAGNWTRPAHQGLARLTMHLFTPGELTRLLRSAGFAILEMRPVGLGPGGRLAWPWLAASWRADGWLVAARAASAGQGARR
ncbi:MAG TPA: methyltransferase domain-containing protein, partial [Gemmatales bacterium]|nr:methyltransferase domain-containing protein [Gemmatales bacterium]